MSRLPIAALLLSVASINPVHAVATTALSTFTFTGQCADCDGTATGTLTVQNYTLGNDLTNANVISFTYDGTNLLMPYTIIVSSTTFVAGSIDSPLPASENVSIQDGVFSFYSGAPGYWCVGGSCNADFGTTHQWSDGTASVPEPISLSLLGGSLLGLAALRRKT